MSANAPKVPAPAIATISSLENRLVAAKLALGAVIGLCVGALLGALAFGALGSDTTATAFLRLQNPADLTAIAGGADQITPDNQDNTAIFVGGEIAYLSGEGFAQAVGRKMAEDEPAELSVAQANESAVITISTSSSSRDEAIRTVQTAIDLYREQIAQRADQQLRTILPALTEWEQRADIDPTRIQDLQRIRESVQMQAGETGTLLIVQPPTPNHPSSGQWLIGAFLGALVGGSGVVAVLLARRRRSGRVAVVKTLTDSVDGVLLPAVDLDVVADDQARLARTLYAQLPSSGAPRLVLVLGASSSSGSAAVASLLETAAAETQPAALSSGHHSSPTSQDSPAPEIVDGGAVGDATLSPEIVSAATDIVLVARLDADTVTQAVALRSAAASGTAPVVAVFTYRRGRGPGFGKRRSSE